jgi:hypothetical protein
MDPNTFSAIVIICGAIVLCCFSIVAGWIITNEEKKGKT